MLKKNILIALITFFISLQLFSQDTVKLFVALWDSPPKSDLYWGKMYGIKPYFSRSNNWEIIQTTHPDEKVLEQILFYNSKQNIYLDAMAYHTDSIKRTITDFIECAYDADTNKLVIYVGHDGLMDFDLDILPQKNKCDVMVFSCASDYYFSPFVNMILSTYTFMAPEAYVVMAAIESWATHDNEMEIRKKTAKAYAKYQKTTVTQAERTFLEE